MRNLSISPLENAFKRFAVYRVIYKGVKSYFHHEFKVIVIGPDAVWPVLEENNFSQGVSGLSQQYIMSI